MRDEEINKKIKDAADQYHPAYEDEAWKKMEQLLDEHLPQKKKRRRIVYLILPLLLLLIGAASLIYYNTIPSTGISKQVVSKDKKETPQTAKNETSVAGNITPNPAPALPKVNNEAGIKNNIPSKKSAPNSTNINAAKNDKPFADNFFSNSSDKKKRKASIETKDNSSLNLEKNTSINKATSQQKSVSEKDIPSTATKDESPAGNDPLNKPVTSALNDKKETIKSKDSGNIVKSDISKKAKANIKQKKTFIQNIGIGLSFGPDVSATRINNAGKITLNVGGELSYSLSDKFTLCTGFYAVKKIYSVGENDYHVQPGTGNYNYLQSVDANCKVYEVPIALSYNFGKVKNHNWFASLGFSSYFMKKESYVYFYKNSSGYEWNKSWSVKNQNKHYFSVLDISGGYEYSINKEFSLRAEPYIKLPLSGIGAGKIKLNSAGILFTVAVKPFK
jgi:hypothetical protein